MNVQIFIPCFVDQLFPQTAFNMIKILEKAGCTVSYNENQTCCGQPAFNAGFREESKIVCTKFVNDFAGSDYVVVPSASCVGFIRNYYGSMFTDSSFRNEVKQLGERVFELSEFLINVLHFDDFGAVFHSKVTYHDSCAGLRECKIKNEPRKLLSKVKGLEIVEMEDVETCCGFGGTFAVKFDTISGAMADQKTDNAIHIGAEYIVSTDLSCLMHIQTYAEKHRKHIQTMHLADILSQGW